MTILEDGARLEAIHAEARCDCEEVRPEAPRRATLEDGREVLVVGDVERGKKAWEFQGNNELGLQASGGLAAVAGLLSLCGVGATYEAVVAYAERHKLYSVQLDANGRVVPELSGGTTAEQRLEILKGFGVEAQSARVENLQQIADALAAGRNVIVSVNAGVLWKGMEPAANFDSHHGNGEHNHVVGVLGVALDPETRQIVGFYINDPADQHGAGRFVSADVMQNAVIGTKEQPVFGEMIAASPREGAQAQGDRP